LKLNLAHAMQCMLVIGVLLITYLPPLTTLLPRRFWR
jgi:hypothetical protein